jgi:hypothetical protein
MMLVEKYANHQPLNRQSDGNWLSRSGWCSCSMCPTTQISNHRVLPGGSAYQSTSIPLLAFRSRRHVDAEAPAVGGLSRRRSAEAGRSTVLRLPFRLPVRKRLKNTKENSSLLR